MRSQQSPSRHHQHPNPSSSSPPPPPTVSPPQNTHRGELSDTTAPVSTGGTSSTRDEPKAFGSAHVTFTRAGGDTTILGSNNDESSVATTSIGGGGAGTGVGRDRFLSAEGFTASPSDTFSDNEESSEGSVGSSFYSMNHLALANRSDSDDDDVKDAKDAKALQESLLKAFPDSLRHIAVDEAAAEALLSNDPAGAVESGYHRQFSELVLREVHHLLTRTASTLQARKRYVMRHYTLEFDRVGPRALESMVAEESARSLSEWDSVWYHGPPDSNGGILAAVTVRPPRFTAGMLWNAEDRFLLGGTAFLEEARLLQLRLPGGSRSSVNTTSVSLGADSSGPGKTTGQEGGGGGGDQTSNLKPHADNSEQRTHVWFLLREYISVSKAGLGCMVQTFSIIPSHVSLNVTRSHSIHYSLIQGILEQCAPGAVTRAFPLSMLLPQSVALRANSATIGGALNTPAQCSRTQAEFAHTGMESMFAPMDDSLSFMTTKSLFSTSPHRPSKVKHTWRQPLGDEVYLRFTNPKLYAWVIQRQPAVLTSSINIISEYIRYSQRLRFRRKMSRLLRAVRTIQRFFRVSLGRKKRAVQRMLHQWRQLELDCRERLKIHTFLPTATNRISFIVATVLWQHIVTTDQYKLSMLEEQFSARRAAYKKWCAQRTEECQAKQDTSLGVSFTFTNTPLVDSSNKEMGVNNVSCSLSLSGGSKQQGAKIMSKSHFPWISRWGDVLHARFGWYIDPEELLLESHRRMLVSLRSSILTMSEVQEELKKTCKGPVLSLV
ncbi:uncharacterized protein TM35_000083460 [Trypanosoma theileri]|uniref:Uncharacterized protein n=1 Tax=Trypanosoma theileri TaxID=67003 RepID=A0A1X0P136_9TRYP|nr:uncharacterized protein TM35_000083460 [Trypanosoma theileri]ORC90548.1 hypothetical protein TM35_000083460 [Trypanosoma theileri]